MNEQETAVAENLAAQIAAVTGLRGSVESQVLSAAQGIASRTGAIVFVGVGKSGHICTKLTATFTSLGHYAHFVHPIEALHGDLGCIHDGDAVILVSHSGKSAEVVKLGQYIQKHFSVTLVAITGNSSSALADMANYVISYQLDAEGCPVGVAPMASTTVTLVIGHLLATALTVATGFQKRDFAKFHPGGSLGLAFQTVGEQLASDSSPPQVTATAALPEVVRAIETGGVGITAVLDGACKLVGSITDGDIRRAITEKLDLASVTANDIMHVHPKTTVRADTLLSALTLMEEHKITSVFVVDDRGALCGVLHMHDIIEGNVVKA